MRRKRGKDRRQKERRQKIVQAIRRKKEEAKWHKYGETVEK